MQKNQAHRRVFGSLVALLTFASAASAQTLKCEKYKLDNGLTVIFNVDHSLPIATVNLWYHVGAKNEPPGRSGFAHLFEHLMFMGTKRVPGNQFDVLMEAGGGDNNASTELDRTNYFSQGPAELLPTLLWLDADRMEAIGPSMTTEKLNRQRDIVRNEIRQQVENTPYGRAYEEMFRYMYPVGHPYHNAVYGTHADLEAAQLNDVRDFFATFYEPANCSLVVAGDFDPATIKPLIEKLYGSIAAGSAAKIRAVPPAKLDHVVRATELDKVDQPKIIMVYHSPAAYQAGEAEIGLAGQILGSGQSSRLYKRLVLKDQTCTDVSAFPYPGQLQSLMLVDVTTKPDADLPAVEKAIDEELAAFADKGPTAEELNARKASIELDTLSSLQSIQARADKLNEYEFYYGNPDSLQRDLDRFRNATVEGVRDEAKAVLTPDARLIMHVLPEDVSEEGTARDQQPPAVTQPATVKLPTPETFKLDDGVRVMLFHKAELPMVSAHLLVKAKTLTIDSPEKAGRGELLTQMMDQGTGDLDGPAYEAALQSLGATAGMNAGRTAITSTLTVLDRNFAPAAKLWLDATYRPRMRDDDFDRVKKLYLVDLEQSEQEPGQVANKLGQMLLFNHDTEYGVPAGGTIETVTGVSFDDVKNAEQDFSSATDRTTLFVAGNITADQVKAALNPLLPKATPAAAPSTTDATTLQPTLQPASKLRVAIVDRPDAAQTAVRLFAPGVVYADEKRVPLDLFDTILGGSFTSRLNADLREAKGYTYGAGSNFRNDPKIGWFVASADVKSDVTGPAIKDMLADLKKISAGDITAEEFNKATTAYRAGLISRFATLQSLTTTASSLEENGVPFESLATDLATAQSAKLDQLNKLAGEYPKLDHSVLVLVGDEKLIREQIKDLGLPNPESYDARGKPVEGADGKK